MRFARLHRYALPAVLRTALQAGQHCGQEEPRIAVLSNGRYTLARDLIRLPSHSVKTCEKINPDAV